MASFPVLKSGAVAQYGSDRERRFSTRVLRFVDQKEQRFPLVGASLKRWVVRLELLDEAELGLVEDFFLSESGRAGSFEFTDPWDQTVHPDCSLEEDSVAMEYEGHGRNATTIVIRENR